MVTDPEIAGTLQAEPERRQGRGGRLVALANKNGGADNVTAIVVRMECEEKGWFSWLRRGGAQRLADKEGLPEECKMA